MTDISDARAFIQEEETQFRAAVSEALLTKAGGAINFINNRQHLLYQFNINGPYLAGAQTGIDGFYPIIFDVEITGITVFSLVAGTGGTTTMDLHRFTSSGTDAGTIFSVKPSIDSTASANAYGTRDIITPVDYPGTGVTLPTFSTTQFNAGDAIRFDLDAAMTGNPQNCGLIMFYRPR